MTVPTYDYDQRDWKKIYGPEELNKIGELLTGIPANEIIPTTTNNKPTVRIKRAGLLKGASVHRKDDRAEKVLRLLTGNI
jgi:hypothetical protein